MVSRKYKCIFVEVPKTASTSIRVVLGKPWKPHMNLSEIRRHMASYWPYVGSRKDRICEFLYLTLSERRRAEIGEQRFNAYFKFGFVRNPWDRVVSLYDRMERGQVKNEMSFDQFVSWIQYSSATCIHPSPHRYQLDWFVDGNGNMLADFIGRFEQLEEDWRFIARKLGITKPLPHYKANPRARHYSEYYNDRTRQTVAERFRVDIEYFGYEFGK